MYDVRRKQGVPLGDGLRSLEQIFVFFAGHGLAYPIGRSAGRNGETDFEKCLAYFSRRMMRAVLIADNYRTADFAVGWHSTFVVRLLEESIHTLKHRLATLDGWPSQIGVAMTRMSASRTRLRSAGQSSPSP